MLEEQGEGAPLFVEADRGSRRRFLAAVVLALGVAAALAFFALRPPEPSADPALELKTLAQRALWSALLATAFALAAGGVALWLASRAVQTRQWPPSGMRVPFRTRVQALTRPAVAWGLAGAIVVALVGVALLYWLHYLQASELSALYAP